MSFVRSLLLLLLGGGGLWKKRFQVLDDACRDRGEVSYNAECL